MSDDRRRARPPQGTPDQGLPEGGGRDVDGLPRPLLRAGLDRELAHLTTTPQARRRLQEAAAGASARSSWRTRRGGRWTGPLTVAAVAAVVIAIPVAATHQLRRLPPAPPAGGITGPAASAGGSSPPPTTRPIPPTPVSSPQASPTRAGASGPRPSAVRPSGQRLELLPAGSVTVIGSPLRLAVLWSAAEVPATTPSPALPAAPRGTPTAEGVAVLAVSWGDGQQSTQRVQCVGGALPARSQLTFSHVYRSPGTFRISAVPLEVSACGERTRSAPVEVRVRSR